MGGLSLDVKIYSQNTILKNPPKEPAAEGALWRGWKIQLVAVDGTRELEGLLSEIVDYVEYILHPTFENPRRVVTTEPYALKEKGWGEFDMRILIHFKNNIANTEVMLFDLNFGQRSYSAVHTLYFPNPSAELVETLKRARRRPSKPNKISIDDKSREDASPDSLSELSETSRKEHSDASPIEQGSDYGKLSTYQASSPVTLLDTTSYNGTVKDPNRYLQDIQSAVTPEVIKSEFDKYWSHGAGYAATKAEAIEMNKRPKKLCTMTDLGRQAGEQYAKEMENLRRPIVDDVYSEQDLDKVDPIHGSQLDANLKEAWGIPPEVNMLELARHLTRMDDKQKDRFFAIISENKADDATVQEDDDEMSFDLYSLGPTLLSKLWKEFVHEVNS